MSLREIMNSEKIILLKLLLNENIYFQSANFQCEAIDNKEIIAELLDRMENEILEASLPI